MPQPLSFPRLICATFVTGDTAAFALPLTLHYMAHRGGGNDCGNDALPTVGQWLGMRVVFCFFTLSAAAFALPFGRLWRRVGPIHQSLCALIGAVCGVLGGYGLLMLTFTPTVN